LYDGHSDSKYITSDVVITFYTSNKSEYVELELSRIGRKRLSWNYFNKNEIKYISELFDMSYEFSDDYSCSFVKLDNHCPMLNIALKKSSFNDDIYFLIIFYYDDGEGRRNPELYVHGIWEVELSEELKKTIFENNSTT
jgi:hypothetical protein